MHRRPRLAIATATLMFAIAGGHASAASGRLAPERWQDVKCARYKTAWAAALTRLGTQGLGQDFLDRHAAFLASNCTRRSDVCPRSQDELALANLMVVLSMNFGAASTFTPSACR